MAPPEKQLKEMGLREIRALARTRMPAEAWNHFIGAAESGATLRRNQKALGRFLFRQKIFHDITNPDTAIDLFGRKLPIPAAIAPVGSFSLISDDAERQVAEAAGHSGVMMFVSHAAKPTVRDWSQFTSAPLVFMGYLSRGREAVLDQAKQAEDLGFAAVGITMDVVQPVKLGDRVPLSTKDGKPRRGQSASTTDIEWLKKNVSLPVVIKGIMGAGDARAAVNAGADALIVSNHGGRILDFNRAAIEVLPEVLDAVGKEVAVLLDSGIRSGGDVVKAIALGAKAVLIGRPIGWGVGAAGAEGVERVIDVLSEEIRRVLIMTGTPSVRDVSQSILIHEQAAGGILS
jgi:isopentenyl diphosphate isomerase/L-lactate dehydrogenase-like FMN-dependent dehydrogenase